MNQVDQIPAIAATGGTATITLHLGSHGGDVTTGALNWNDSGATIKAALIAAAGVGSDFDVSDTFVNGLNVTYKGTLANTLFATLTLNSSLTGGITAPPQPSQTTAGVAPVAGTKATLTLTVSLGVSTLLPDGGTWIFDGVTYTVGESNGSANWVESDAQTPQSGGPMSLTATANGVGTQPAFDTSNLTMAAGTLPWDGTLVPSFTPGTDDVTGVAVVHTFYTRSTSNPATGGTFTLAGGSALAFDDATIAADYSTATGQTFALTGGIGTQASAWVLTGPQAPVTPASADYSGLTMGITATPSTVTPSSGGVPGALLLLGVG